MPAFIPAYDAERPGACLAAAKALVALHERLGLPATFFVVGELLRDEPEWRHLLASPLFEVASHTWSHKLLRPAPNGDPAVSEFERSHELTAGKDVVEDTFGRPCLGVRPANGYSEPMDGDRWLIAQIAGAGYQYVSSQLWGPGYSPAPLRKPWRYDGLPVDFPLWELPAHGPHDTAPGHWLRIGEWWTAAEIVGAPLLSFVRHPWRIAERDDFGRIEGELHALTARGFPVTTYAQQRGILCERQS